jgi:WD40 repeat protein
LGPAEDALTRFAADLRTLREDAGTPTYRQLSARAHYSAAALSEAASGRKLPSLPVTLAYVRACDGDVVAWEQRWRDVSATQAEEPAHPVARPDEEAPYAGFAPIEDPALFAGRADLVAELAARVRERRLTAVVGASGSGKTSLVMAGLLPTLDDHVVMTPGPRPLEECAIRLADVVGVAPGDLYRELAQAPENLHLRVRQAFADRPGDLVLVVDRFEEAITGERADEHFVAALVHAATATTSRVRIVLAVRADVADRLPPAIQDEQVHVGPMTADGLREAITDPATVAGCRVETALLVRLIADTGGPGTLPFLQQALLEAWRRRRGTTLTVASYEAAGDIPRLIAEAAEAVFTALDADGQRVARHLLPRLASTRGLRRDDLDADAVAVLDELVAARVVVTDRDHLRLAGRSLRERWPRLCAWLAEDRDWLKVQRELAEATSTWESLGRDPGALYRGVRLDAALAADTPVITAGERDFLRASVAARAGERWRVRRFRAGLAVLSVLVVVATAGLAYVVRADRTADRQYDAAAARSALREAAGLLDTDPALAMQLTIAAHRLDPTAESRNRVLELFAEPYASRLTAHTATVHAVAVNGEVLATAGDDATRLWDIGDPNHPRDLAVLPDSATSVVLSADGRVAVTGTPAGAVLWNLTAQPRPLRIGPVGRDNLPTVSPALVALSPDGRTLALSKENDVRLYDITFGDKPRRLGTLTGGTDPVTSVAFGRDGATVLTTSGDHRARLWPVAGGEPVVLAGDRAPVLAATFSPDGRFVATAGEDGTVTVWRVADRTPVASTGVRGAVRDVAFSPDGLLLAATGDDQSTTVWDVADPGRPRQVVALTGHTDAGTGVRFTPDGRTLITSSRDRTVRLVDLAEVIAGRDGGGALAWQGTVLAAGSNGTVRLFDMRNRHAPRIAGTVAGPAPALAPGLLATGGDLWDVSDPRRPHPHADVGDATGSALSRDGRFLVTLHENGPPKLWSVVDPGKPLAVLPAAGSRAAAFGDGVVATLGHDLRLWDLTDPAHPKATTLLSRMWTGMALRPDGTVLAAMARDGVGWLWDVSDLGEPKVLGKFPAGPTKAVAFAPDGTLLVTATGSTPELWDVTDPRRPSQLATLRSEQSQTVATVVFSPDGSAFAAAGADGALHVWDVSVDAVERRVCAVTQPRLGEDAWARYLPDVPYEPVCD